nr:lyase family protein [Microbacterium sp. SYP-A9085]
MSPVTVGHDDVAADRAVLDALVTAEAALARAWAAVGTAPAAAADEISRALGWQGPGRLAQGHSVDVTALAAASVSGGNPVIPLVARLKERVPEAARAWVHRGATSQDILDTAIMLLARAVVDTVKASLAEVDAALVVFARAHRDEVGAARTLTQHAVPTTIGARAATWLHGIRRAVQRLQTVQTPAQLGGAGGTLAAFVQIAGDSGADAAAALPAAFAREAGLDVPAAPWHVTRWPVTELGDALVQAIDAVGKMATDVATLGRTEIGELTESRGGGSSAMPQKQNPVASVLIRSAALRAPQLAATLHLASALAADERPDGAWHAEWPTLRDLLRLAAGATAHAAALVGGLQVHPDAVSRNLGLTRGLIVSERLSLVLAPRIGKDAVARLVAEAAAGADLAVLVAALPEASDLDVHRLLDPAQYTGLAGRLVDAVGDPSPEESQ